MHTYFPFLINTASPIYYERREKKRDREKDFHQQVYLKGSKLNGTIVTTADI